MLRASEHDDVPQTLRFFGSRIEVEETPKTEGLSGEDMIVLRMLKIKFGKEGLGSAKLSRKEINDTIDEHVSAGLVDKFTGSDAAENAKAAVRQRRARVFKGLQRSGFIGEGGSSKIHVVQFLDEDER
jgi:hypothetical protein